MTGSANFEFEAPVAATILLGNLAARTGKLLTWDAASVRFTNVAEANRYVDREYRQNF